VKDVLEHAVVVSNGDLGALCTALEQAVDSDRERALSQAADLRERLSWTTMAKRQETVYDAVMRTPR
jgi:hypothetical protein